MKRFLCTLSSAVYIPFRNMANLPPRKISTSNKAKQYATPLQILLQMGFPKHRALKALAATGNRSVQLASDWLLTHVNDAFIDTDEAREYIFYASPTGPLLAQLLEFWDKSKTTGWNGAHNFPPHITLVSFFKAPDETSLQLGKAVKHVVENVGDPPSCPLKLEPYISHNFMGLFVSEEHADYLKKIAVQYVKQVSAALGVTVDTYEHLDALGTCFPWCAMQQEKPIKSISLEPHVKSLHITLAFHFDVSAYETLKSLVEELQPAEHSNWELRLYSRDPRFAKHQVHKVIQDYTPKANDELELVIGDYVYIEEKELDGSPDGWVLGTSWLTGVSGYLPAVCARRTAESDAWTLHRAISLGNNNSGDCKSESDSNTDVEMAGIDTNSTSYPHEDATELGLEKSHDINKEWGKYWSASEADKRNGILSVTQGKAMNWNSHPVEVNKENGDAMKSTKDEEERRWIFAMRHGERVDLTYGHWTTHCFDENDTYIRKDLNLPLSLPERAGGKDSYHKDSPLTRVGRFQAYLVGEGLRLAGISIRHVYSSAAFRCVETAQAFLEGLQADPSVKIKVEPGLFEYKLWHSAKGLAPFMTVAELNKAGFHVDTEYKPYIDLDVESVETLNEYYMRNEKIMQTVIHEHEADGGNIIFIGHAPTLDMLSQAIVRINKTDKEPFEYQVTSNLLNIPYCALLAARDKPWEVVCPPCPPSINSSSGRFDWRLLVKQ